MTERVLKPHEERVVAERYDLDGKITRLSAFLGQDNVTRDVPSADIHLLNQQLCHMRDYLRVLDLRIARFYQSI